MVIEDESGSGSAAGLDNLVRMLATQDVQGPAFKYDDLRLCPPFSAIVLSAPSYCHPAVMEERPDVQRLDLDHI